MRAKTESLGAAALIATVPPHVGHLTPDWLAVALALIAPWVWVVVIDRLLRRTR